MLDRIAALRKEAEAAFAAPPDSAALEELRVKHLGRKAELPNLLRGVAELPPAERGAVGKAANQARQALEALIGARPAELAAPPPGGGGPRGPAPPPAATSSPPPSSTPGWPPTASTSRCPARRSRRS